PGVQNSGYRASRRPGREAVHDELGDGRPRHQHALIDIQLQSRKKSSMREISQGNPLVDSAPQQFVDARAAALAKRPAIGVAGLGVIDSRDKKHQLRRLVAGIVGTVSKVYASPLQGAGTPLD